MRNYFVIMRPLQTVNQTIDEHFTMNSMDSVQQLSNSLKQNMFECFIFRNVTNDMEKLYSSADV